MRGPVSCAMSVPQIVAALDLGQAGGKVSQPRLAEVDHVELDESAAHGWRVGRRPCPGRVGEPNPKWRRLSASVPAQALTLSGLPSSHA